MSDRKLKTCDFCADNQTPAWTYHCKSFIDEDTAVNMLDEWLACNICSEMIEEENLKALVERALSTYLKTHPAYQKTVPQLRNHIFQLHVKFWNHRKGNRLPWASNQQ